MLSKEDNEILCRVGPGTPMGELFRRFWLPALLCTEIARPDCTPRRLRILGEDLVAFRDTDGNAAVISAYCPHKLAPLYFGRNEEGGLRCVYHGWKFDKDGKCVDIPNLPARNGLQAMKDKAAIPGYPVREAGGMVWVYMGPPERMPELPGFEWLNMPPEQNHVARWLQQTNWAQGMEGEIDSSHISFLHREFVPSWSKNPTVRLTATIPDGTADASPVLSLKETPYGFVYGARRNNDSGEFYWRVTQWYVPMYSMIPNSEYPYSGRAWVPVDDYNVMVFNYAYRADRAYTVEERLFLDSGPSFPPPKEEMPVRLEDGYVIDTWVPLARASNNYDLNRDRQRHINYSGISVVTDQDRALQENMPSGFGLGIGRIVDRSRELLVASDVPVITARRILIKMAKDLQQGKEPPQPHDASMYESLSMAALAPQENFEEFLAARAEQ
jgi:phenylpropionate dioxygenase-like ring-hydroxylating dioxygenase large terminal subunit